MPVIKVWTADRTQRKAVFVSRFDVNEVIDKAKQKVGFHQNEKCKLVLELDGTEVDEDGILEEFRDQTLLVMRSNEEWRKDGVTFIIDDTPVDTLIRRRSHDTTLDVTIDQKPDLANLEHLIITTETNGSSVRDRSSRNAISILTANDDSPTNAATLAVAMEQSGESISRDQSEVARHKINRDQQHSTKKSSPLCVRKIRNKPALQGTSATKPKANSSNKENEPNISVIKQQLPSSRGTKRPANVNGSLLHATQSTATKRPKTTASSRETAVLKVPFGETTQATVINTISHYSWSASPGKSQRRNSRSLKTRTSNANSCSKTKLTRSRGVSSQTASEDNQFKQVFHFEAAGRVLGIAHVDGSFFIVTSQSNTIHVRDDRSPYKRRPDLTVDELRDPRDIVSASLPSYDCLYILDCGKSVWKIGLQHGGAPTDFQQLIQLEKNFAGTLNSLPNGELLLTNWTTQRLEVYGEQGQLQRTIELPKSFEAPLHAVILENSDLLISHGIKDTKHRVCITSDNGKQVKHIFGDKAGSSQSELNNPSYLSVLYQENAKKGIKQCHRVFVADEYNNRVLVLDGHLSLQSDLQVDQPHRLCYVEKHKLLVVSSKQSVTIFCVGKSRFM